MNSRWESTSEATRSYIKKMGKQTGKTNFETVNLECHLEFHVPLQEVINVLSTRLRKTLIAIVRDIKICLCTCNTFEDRNVYILCVLCLSVYLSRGFLLQYRPVCTHLLPFIPAQVSPRTNQSGQCQKIKTKCPLGSIKFVPAVYFKRQNFPTKVCLPAAR